MGFAEKAIAAASVAAILLLHSMDVLLWVDAWRALDRCCDFEGCAVKPINAFAGQEAVSGSGRLVSPCCATAIDTLRYKVRIGAVRCAGGNPWRAGAPDASRSWRVSPAFAGVARSDPYRPREGQARVRVQWRHHAEDMRLRFSQKQPITAWEPEACAPAREHWFPAARSHERFRIGARAWTRSRAGWRPSA
jgi:hypothetical protein